MPRNRYKNKHAKKVAQEAAPQQAERPVIQPSPAAQALVQRITEGEPGFTEDNFIRVMLDSEKLAAEPEFLDLNFDSEKAIQITDRKLRKYEKRLEAAYQQGEDEHQQVADDMRIEVIDELATPHFRREVRQRLDQLIDRLIQGQDTNKLEIALLLKAMLRAKEIPWGICGLIIAIYNRAIEEFRQELAGHADIFSEITEALKAEGHDVENIEEFIQSPEKFQAVDEKVLDKNPSLRERLEKQTDEIVDKFEDDLFEGKITLDLFTDEELLLPFEYLQEEAEQAEEEIQDTEETGGRLFQAIQKAIKEIMTPERFQRLRKDMETKSKNWIKQRNPRGAVLQIELGWLEDTFQNDRFIYTTYIGEIRRKSEAEQRAQKKKR